MHGKIMIQDQRAKVAVSWAMVRGVKSGFIDMWLVDKNKGDNYVVVSIWFVTSHIVPYVMAPMNFAFNKPIKMAEPVC